MPHTGATTSSTRRRPRRWQHTCLLLSIRAWMHLVCPPPECLSSLSSEQHADNFYLEHNGAYVAESKPQSDTTVHCWGRDAIDAERLWALSEGIIGQKFDY
jgi:hypothetical protein